MRIIFMGSPEFALTPLDSLLKSKHEVIAVYTRTPKPSGRGKKNTKTPVHIASERNNLKVYIPSSLNSVKEQEILRNLKPDVIVVTAYGLFLPKKVLDIPKYGCINIHPSLLPRWRGAAPIQHAILAGDEETGVSIMQMNEMLDAGDILKQDKIHLEKDYNYSMLHDKLSKLGSKLLIEVLDDIANVSPIFQEENGVCYASKISDYKIYITDTCESACRKVKALYPKAFFNLEGKRIRILDASCISCNINSEENIGAIINNSMHIRLHQDIFIPKIVQIEGKKPCDIESFIRGLKFNLKGKVIT
ncbi:methionyl-tRNA formyltransferase [Wolbachia endosymbiont of Pentidionis agamae]|uniref:methionyl-tRNA formyltransferase n=1 Tax=Wolbachia endosymbiont of Pentidionis agamae TaxID=3110435 RepID=UPI002FCFC6AA